jgi:hypothetical protein
MNIKRVPELEELKKLLEKQPDFLKIYQNAETLIGPSDSISYIVELVKAETKERQ